MSYSSLNIIDDPEVNWICDKLIAFVKQEFTGEESETRFALSGRASAIMQGMATNPIQNIIFITDDFKIYDYLKTIKKNMLASGIIIYKNRILLYFPTIYVEIWFSNEPLNIVDFSGIKIQDIDQIPRQTL
jgi:hypothetical protein